MTHNNWAAEAFFYHIYPLGLCGAPQRNDFASPPVNRLGRLKNWSAHIAELGANAVYLGPVFESGSHGYDTADYFKVDRRLGQPADLKDLAADLHSRSIRVVLDAVFNHVGRGFWGFKELQADPAASRCRGWFDGLDLGGRSAYGDPFSYRSWSGCQELVNLDLKNPEVKEHLLEAVRTWIRDYDIDGLRLDAADSLDLGFLRELSAFCKSIKPDFWLMGEIVGGDYRRLLEAGLDSVTNYECYKGLYSSHNDRNYFEIAYALNRQFGEGGLFRGRALYNFCDNHDVNRLASALKDRAHLFTTYALMFTMPGIPSVYYGSEWGLEGARSAGGDKTLRPQLDDSMLGSGGELQDAIKRFAGLRARLPALRTGGYRPLHTAAEQLVFARETADECAVAALNASDKPVQLELALGTKGWKTLRDELNQGQTFPVENGKVKLDLPAHWARVLRAV